MKEQVFFNTKDFDCGDGVCASYNRSYNTRYGIKDSEKEYGIFLCWECGRMIKSEFNRIHQEEEKE